MGNDVNSKDYWDRRFHEDWEDCNGPFQTEMFARVALRSMPGWLVQDVRTRSLSIVDVGCAEGDAVNLLSKYFAGSDVVGCDFSTVAIAKAQERYPELSFFCGDAADVGRAFDVVFCSNVMEHFSDPLQLMDRLSRVALRHLILMVPVWELRRHSEHEYTFQASSFPSVLSDGKVGTVFDIVNTSRYPEKFWEGWQGFVVYSEPSAVRELKLSLADVVESLSMKSMTAGDIDQASVLEPVVASVLRSNSANLETFQSIAVTASKVAEAEQRREQIGSAIKESAIELQREAINEIVAALSGQLAALSSKVSGELEQVHIGIGQLNADSRAMEIQELKSDYEVRVNELKAELEAARLNVEEEVLRAKHQRDSYKTQADWMRGKIHSLQTEVNTLRFERQVAVDAKAVFEARVKDLEASTSWRVTGPLRRVSEFFKGQSKSDSAIPSIAHHQTSSIDYSGQLADILEKHAGKRIIVFPPLVDWDLPLFQRPHHIASRLARRGYLYFYCTPNGYDGINGFVEVEDGLYVTDQFAEVAGLYRDKVIHLYSTDNATKLDWIVEQQSNLAKILYEYIDEIDPTISGAEIPDHVWIKHRALISDPSVAVVASADKLADEVRAVRGKVELVTNGVDVGHFRGRESEPVPEEIRDFVENGRPVIGYFGALAVWFDYQLVCKLAVERPDYNILILGWDYDGSLGRSGLEAHPNVKVIGPIPYKELPKYSRHFSVSTIPFLINPVTESTSPIKLFEYMSMGTPIVTTDLPECRKYRSVMIGHTHEEFVALVDQALGRMKDAGYRALLAEEAEANDWDAKAEAIARMLD